MLQKFRKIWRELRIKGDGQIKRFPRPPSLLTEQVINSILLQASKLITCQDTKLLALGRLSLYMMLTSLRPLQLGSAWHGVSY